MTKETNSLIERLDEASSEIYADWAADIQEGGGITRPINLPEEAATELRRLSAECEALREVVKECADRFRDYGNLAWEIHCRTALQQTNERGRG